MFDSHEYERIASFSDEQTLMDKDVISLQVLASHYLLQKKVSSSGSASGLLMGGKPKQGKMGVDYLEGEKLRLVKLCDSAQERFSNDSVLTYLRAVVLGEFGSCKDIRYMQELLVRAIKLSQWNWAAWLELAQLGDEFLSSELESSISSLELFRFFKLERFRAQKRFSELLAELETLRPVRTEWTYLTELEGVCFHELREFSKALVCFEKLRKADPFYISGMDVYSNCLFVLERPADLFALASHWLETSPNAPETSVIVGNFFSLKSDHEKAALFFKRATAVSPTNANAWLLLGHELIELRNPSAALAAYQQAAARCPGGHQDLRPWYAMGQLFELINQFAFAVYYHNRAAQIDPRDSRVWKALAGCYQKLNRMDESRECALRAARNCGMKF